MTSTLASPLFVHHPTSDRSIDATGMELGEEDLDTLPWQEVFDAMAALEAGVIANPDEGRQVGHYWLRAPELAPTVGQATAIGEVVEGITTFADDVRSGRVTAEDGERFTGLLLVGIGGSALGPQLLVDALAEGDGLGVHFLDNTDPDGIERVLRRIGPRLRHTLVTVVSKSGGTPETANGAALVEARLREQGLEVASRMIAVTGEGSVLHQRAVSEGWLRTFPMWDWVGGRTSVTGAVGLLPAALAGVDVAAFLRGARDMDEWTRTPDWRANPAALLAGCWHVAGGGQGERNMVVLPYADRLLLMSRYLQQLVMESLGKRLDLEGREVFQGITVYGNKGSTDQHAFVQQLRDGRDDFFVTFVQVVGDGEGSELEVAPGANAGDFLQGFLLGTRRALAEQGRPSLVLTVPRVDAHEIGGLIALFERAVGLYASLIGINAYHQPGVEAGKKAAREILDLSVRIREALTDEPATASDVASALGADPVQVFHVLTRLAATGRAVRRGAGVEASFRSPEST